MPIPRGIGRDGLHVDLIGKALVYRLAPIPHTGVGIHVLGQQENTTMSSEPNKAKSDGVYTLNGGQFVIRAGDTLPAGAKFEAKDDVFAPSSGEFVAEDAEIVEGTYAQPVVEERSESVAPQNRAEGSAPQNRAAGGKAK